MTQLPIAIAVEIVFVAAAAAVLLLLVFQIRLAKRHEKVAGEVDRLKRAHKAGTLDARSRLEEASKALESLEETVRPRLESLEPDLADIGSRIDELEERVAKIAPTAEEATRRTTEIEAVVAEAHARMEQAEALVKGTSERFGEVDEVLRDARRRTITVEEGLDHIRAGLGDRLGEIESRMKDLQERMDALADRLEAALASGREPARAVAGASAPSARDRAVESGEERDGTRPDADTTPDESARVTEAASAAATADEEEAEERLDEDGRVHVSEAAAAKRSEQDGPLTHYEGEFTYQGEDHEGGRPGMRGVLVLVFLLAALTLLLQLLT